MKSLYARSTSLKPSIRRAAVVLFSAVTVIGIFSSPAQAGSYTSYMKGVQPGFESTRWREETSATTTTIKFTGCTSDGSVVNVTMAKDIGGAPDTYYTKAAYTKCLESSTSTSTGTWNDHGAGSYYFIVNDGGFSVVSVKSLTVSW
ncbi:hypothetical protein FKN01_07805 [Streptomyces sp. 130]|uniref:hypothetical protein n=1 Tax=Streptomyces sp. 130 TaxID=2591006 RepID=UPI00117D4CE6|nr:hypothetical protein [Streptomyces sp. 130]TRV80101.1 hypothetical protein FKN01_07805 [Streptomyces sp. 130]